MESIMDKLIKLLIFAAIVYGIVWVYYNVDFKELTDNTVQRIEQEKTVTRVTEGRDRAAQDAKRVAE